MRRIWLALLIFAAPLFAQVPAVPPPSIPQIEYMRPVEASVGNANGASWPQTGGIYAQSLLQSVAQNADYTQVLPPSASFAPGTSVTYTDAVTTAVYGRGFIPAGSDTLDGQNSTYWTTAPLNGEIFFRRGGLDGQGNPSSTSITLRRVGTTGWRRERGGIVDFLRDPGTGASAWWDLSSLTDGSNIRMTGSGVIVQPFTENTGLAEINGISADGAVTTRAKYPPDPAEGNVLSWIAGGPVWGGGNAGVPWTPLDPVPNPIVWVPVAGQRVQNAVINLTGDRALDIDTSVSVTSGTEFNLLVIQPAGGNAHLTLTDANTILTGANGLGTIVQTLTGGAIDQYRLHYTGVSGAAWTMYPTMLNGTPAASASCAGNWTTGTYIGSTTGSTENNWMNDATTSRFAMSNLFVATETTMCSVEVNMRKTGTPNFVMHAGVYTDAIRVSTATGATVSTSSNVVNVSSSIFTSADIGQRVTFSSGFAAGTYYVASAPTGTQITVSSDKAGTTPVNANAVVSGMTVSVYGVPGDLLGTASSNNPSSSSLPLYVDAADATAQGATGAPNADQNPTMFSGLANTLVVGTTYHLVLWGSGTGNVSSYPVWMSQTTGPVGMKTCRNTTAANSSSTWAVVFNQKKHRWIPHK